MNITINGNFKELIISISLKVIEFERIEIEPSEIKRSSQVIDRKMSDPYELDLKIITFKSDAIEQTSYACHVTMHCIHATHDCTATQHQGCA